MANSPRMKPLASPPIYTECSECRRLEADLRYVSTEVANDRNMLSWNVEPAPQQINNAVLAALAANPAQRTAGEPWNLFRFAFRHRIRIARWTVAAACVGVAAMILMKVFAPSSTDEFQRLQLAAKIVTAPPETLTGTPPAGDGGAGHEDRKITRPLPSPLPSSPGGTGLADKTWSHLRALKLNRQLRALLQNNAPRISPAWTKF